MPLDERVKHTTGVRAKEVSGLLFQGFLSYNESMKRLFTGLAMMAICVIFMVLFLIPGYRNFYANTPAAFMTVTVLGIAFSITGSYLTRDTLNGGVKKEGILPGIAIFFGELVVMAGVLAGLVSLYGALTLGMIEGYWGWDWGERYYFSYHVNSAANLNISLLSVSMVVTIIGQFMIGYGHKRTGAGNITNTTNTTNKYQ